MPVCVKSERDLDVSSPSTSRPGIDWQPQDNRPYDLSSSLERAYPTIPGDLLDDFQPSLNQPDINSPQYSMETSHTEIVHPVEENISKAFNDQSLARNPIDEIISKYSNEESLSMNPGENISKTAMYTKERPVANAEQFESRNISETRMSRMPSNVSPQGSVRKAPTERSPPLRDWFIYDKVRGMKVFQCKRCFRSFGTKMHLSYHLEKDGCTNTMASMEAYLHDTEQGVAVRRGTFAHTHRVVYSCFAPNCNKVFSSNKDLAIHVRSYHYHYAKREQIRVTSGARPGPPQSQGMKGQVTSTCTKPGPKGPTGPY